MPIVKNCKICGKEFVAKYERTVCCSPECTQENKKLISHEYMRNHDVKPQKKGPKIIAICACCHKPFCKAETNRKKIYCSKVCYSLAQIQNQKNKPRAKKPKVFKDNLEKDVYELEQFNIQRQEHGERQLSYGQYKAYQMTRR